MSMKRKKADMATIKSSRLFIKNLPPNISEGEFREHFSSQGELTDIKLIPDRRIGFVGYTSHDAAARAVKYFNRSFIRMSRISVDIAKPVWVPSAIPPNRMHANRSPKIADPIVASAAKTAPAQVGPSTTPVTPKLPGGQSKDDPSLKKRKRDKLDGADHKLQEFLEVMGHPTKKSRDLEETYGTPLADTKPAVSVVIEAGESDDEYEEIPSRPSKPVSKPPPVLREVDIPREMEVDPPVTEPPRMEPGREPPAAVDATDDDWLRSRTNRLLDLVDPDDPGFAARPQPAVPAAKAEATSTGGGEAETDYNGDYLDSPVREPTGTPQEAASSADPEDLIQKTARLFLRNLSYAVTEDDIREHFGTFGTLSEVGTTPSTFIAGLFHDEPQIGTSYAEHLMRTWARYFSRCFEDLIMAAFIYLIEHTCRRPGANCKLGEAPTEQREAK